MRVVAFDPFVAAERYRELGVEKAETLRRASTREADFLTLHLPKTPETEGWLDAEAFAKMQGRRARAQRRPRPADRRRRPAGRAGLRQGRRRGARRLPLRADHRAPAVRPAQRDRHAAPRRLDRRGDRPRRLPGRRAGRRGARPAASSRPRSTCPRSPPRTSRCSARSCRLPRSSAGSPTALAEGSSVDRIEVEFLGRIAERDTRPLGDRGAARRRCSGHTEEEVNEVNAPAIAEERGIEVVETSSTSARDFTDLVRVTVVAGDRRERVVGTRARPAQPPAPARGLGPALQPAARATHLAIFRYSRRARA